MGASAVSSLTASLVEWLQMPQLGRGQAPQISMTCQLGERRLALALAVSSQMISQWERVPLLRM
jgi:hypothetical protein